MKEKDKSNTIIDILKDENLSINSNNSYTDERLTHFGYILLIIFGLTLFDISPIVFIDYFNLSSIIILLLNEFKFNKIQLLIIFNLFTVFLDFLWLWLFTVYIN